MHDLVTLGEILLRLAIPSPARFETARQLDVQIGGAEANVAAACARLGLRVAWISSLPANQWGERARHELTGHGVDCSFVHTRPDARDLRPHGHRRADARGAGPARAEGHAEPPAGRGGLDGARRRALLPAAPAVQRPAGRPARRG